MRIIQQDISRIEGEPNRKLKTLEVEHPVTSPPGPRPASNDSIGWRRTDKKIQASQLAMKPGLQSRYPRPLDEPSSRTCELAFVVISSPDRQTVRDSSS